MSVVAGDVSREAGTHELLGVGGRALAREDRLAAHFEKLTAAAGARLAALRFGKRSWKNRHSYKKSGRLTRMASPKPRTEGSAALLKTMKALARRRFVAITRIVERCVRDRRGSAPA